MRTWTPPECAQSRGCEDQVVVTKPIEGKRKSFNLRLQPCDDATESWVGEDQFRLLGQFTTCDSCHLRIDVAPCIFDWRQNSDLRICILGDCFKVCALIFRSQAVDKAGHLGMLARPQATFGIAQRLQVDRREAVVMVRRK